MSRIMFYAPRFTFSRFQVRLAYKENALRTVPLRAFHVSTSRAYRPRCIGIITWVKSTSPTSRMTPGLEDVVVSNVT